MDESQLNQWQQEHLASSAREILRELPARLTDPLKQLDGSTIDSNHTRPSDLPRVCYTLGFVEGTASPYVAGPDPVWLTPLGQAIVDAGKPKTPEQLWPIR